MKQKNDMDRSRLFQSGLLGNTTHCGLKSMVAHVDSSSSATQRLHIKVMHLKNRTYNNILSGSTVLLLIYYQIIVKLYKQKNIT